MSEWLSQLPEAASPLDPASLVYVSEPDAGSPTGFSSRKSTAQEIADLAPGDGSGDMLAANNLSDVASAAAARANLGLAEHLIVACSDETTPIQAGTAKRTLRVPFAGTLTGVSASVATAPTGAAIIIDVNRNGNSVLSTKLTIDATEETSATASTPAVIDGAQDDFAADDEVTIDFDQAGSTIAGKGVKVVLTFAV